MKYRITENDQLLFDWLMDFANGGVEKEKAKKISVALNCFMNRTVNTVKRIQAKDNTGFGVSTDFDKVSTETYNMILAEDNFDQSWEQLFDEVSIASGNDAWEIHKVTSGLTFRKVKEGERLDVYGVKGEKVTAYVDKYGGAIGWTDEMIRFRKIAAMTSMAKVFKNRYYENKADNHYALIAAAGLANVANAVTYQGTVADTQLNRDLATLNLAGYTLGNLNKDKGYGNMSTAKFFLIVPELLRTRITRCKKTLDGMVSGGTIDGGILESLEYNINFIFTFNSNIIANTGYLVLPGWQMQRAEAMPLTTFSDNDILTLTNIQAVWTYYGAVIGDTEQVIRVSFS